MADVVIAGGGGIGCAPPHHTAAAGMLVPPAEAAASGPFRDLSRAGLALYPELIAGLSDETGIDVQYTASGLLLVARSEGRAGALQSIVRWSASGGELGLPLEWVEGGTLRALEPALSKRLLGAAYSPDGQHVNPGLLTQALGRGGSHVRPAR